MADNIRDELLETTPDPDSEARITLEMAYAKQAHVQPCGDPYAVGIDCMRLQDHDGRIHAFGWPPYRVTWTTTTTKKEGQ